MSDEKISLYSLNDLKYKSDDAVATYLNSIKFRQSHELSNVRLALGYTAISISAATFLWDYKFGFDSTKVYTAIAVLLYTIVNGILTCWMIFFEKDIIYTGTNPQGDKIEISSKTKKHVPIYNLTIITYLKSQPKKSQILTLKKSFNGWFNKAGYFVPSSFQQMLASNIPLIGAADPTRVISTIAEKRSEFKVSENKKEESTDEDQSISLAKSSVVDIRQESNVRTSKAGKKKGIKNNSNNLIKNISS